MAGVVTLAVLSGVWLGSCAPRTGAAEISREHAVEIARREVSFEADRIEAIRATSGMTPVWRVTLIGRLPGQPPELFETVVIEIDRRSGEIVSIARP
jgi:hypothetical protein